MKVQDFDMYFRKFLDIDGWKSVDSSLNGIQVNNDGQDVEKVCFAVDASLETFKRAKAAGAGMLFVHHGLFWGKPIAADGICRERLSFLFSANLALYACHLPLDAAPIVGINAVLANLLELENIAPFGEDANKRIGLMGTFPAPISAEEASRKIAYLDRPGSGVYNFGKELCKTAAIISGGAASGALHAISVGADLYVTGEFLHSFYHYALEGRLNVVAGGHYNTEVHGPLAVMKKLHSELGVDVEFVDAPTGL